MKDLVVKCQAILGASTTRIQLDKAHEEALEYLEVLESPCMPELIKDESCDVIITAIQVMLIEGFSVEDIEKHIEFKLNRTFKRLGITKGGE